MIALAATLSLPSNTYKTKHVFSSLIVLRGVFRDVDSFTFHIDAIEQAC